MSLVSRIVSCVRIKLRNQQILCFCDGDQDLTYEGEVYYAGSYFTLNEIAYSNELGQDNFSLTGIVNDKYFSRQAIIEGYFNQSYVEVFLTDLISAADKKIILKEGWIEQIKFTNQQVFIIKLHSLANQVSATIGSCYSATCRARFADKYCGIDVNLYQNIGKICKLVSTNSFIDDNREEPDGYYNMGVLTFTTGDSQGQDYQVREFGNKQIGLDYAADLAIKIGDQYQITAGCDKQYLTCIEKFNNILNFRAEPFIPSRHKLVAANY